MRVAVFILAGTGSFNFLMSLIYVFVFSLVQEKRSLAGVRNNWFDLTLIYNVFTGLSRTSRSGVLVFIFNI